MQGSLYGTLFSKKKLEEEVSALKDHLLDTSSYIYFERAKEHVTFFHPKLDMSPMDIFKVVYDGHLMHEEKGHSSDMSVASINTNTKDELNKETKEVHPEDAFE